MTEKTENTPRTFPIEEFCALVRSGLWPRTALAYLGQTWADWEQALADDPKRAEAVRKAAAGFEVLHIRNLHAKIQEANDWRGSAWWLAQRFPKRYGSRGRGEEGPQAVAKFLDALEHTLVAELSDPADFDRIGRAIRKAYVGFQQ